MKDITAFSNQVSAKKFSISIGGEYTLSVEDIWPDGDAPENPTSADVAAAIDEDCIDVASLIKDWNMPCWVDVRPVGVPGKSLAGKKSSEESMNEAIRYAALELGRKDRT